jgi:membrane associated rhomboid family serine protease
MKRFPSVTVALALANLLAYALELAAGGEPFCQAHGLVPARFVASDELGPVFTQMFLHDPGSLAHIGGNLAFLLVLGTVAERSVGGLRFLAVYLGAGVAGALLHVTLAPGATDALVGASGCLFGIAAIAAAAQPRKWLAFVVTLVSWNLWLALSGTAGAVSVGDHVGGFLVGAVFVLVARMAGSDCLEVHA